jgi:hypothetical protein
MYRYLVALAAAVTVAVVVTGSACFPASASSLNVHAASLQAESHNIAMCDENVTFTPHTTLLGIIDTLTVSSISPTCAGDTLRIVFRTILGITLETSTMIPADGPGSVAIDVISINLPLVSLGTTYFAFEPH